MNHRIPYVTVEVPQEWTSYIFNDDPSALSDLEQRQCDAWLDDVGYNKNNFLDCDATGKLCRSFSVYGTGHAIGMVVQCKVKAGNQDG